MIPTAQTLTDILNDPAIPAEAKPWGWSDRHVADWQGGHGNGSPPYIGVSINVRPSSVIRNLHAIEAVNAAMFWSLSAWLWGRGEDVRVSPTGLDSGFGAGYPIDEGYDSMFAPTTVEALAAVVREVAATRPAR